MIVLSSKLYQRVSLFMLSFVLAISSLSLAVPLFLSHTAVAVGGVNYTNTGFSSLSWSQDRTLPSGAWAVIGDSLSMTVDGSNKGSDSFEGLKASLPANTNNVSARLYIDPNWQSESVIAGMWGVVPNGSNTSDLAWPTLEFNNIDNATASVDVFDTFGTGASVDGVTTVNYGDIIQLEIQVNTTTDEVNYYLNDAIIYSTPAYGYGPISDIIFNNYNDGVGGSTYTTTWTNLHTGIVAPPAPTPPTVTITSPTLNQPINGRTVTIKGTATDTDFNYYYCYVSNVNGHEYGARDASCNTTWHAVETASTLGTISLSSDLPDGNYVVHLIAYDKAGNSKETTQPFMLDNAVPTQPVFTSPANNLFTKTNFVTMTWANGDDPGMNQTGIKGYVIRYNFVPMDGGSAVGWTSGIIANGNPKAHSGTYGHGQGTYTIYVSTVDNAGNVSLESSPLVLSYDSTAPVAIITAPTVSAVSGNTLAIEGTATDTNFNYYYCYVTNASGEVGVLDPQCTTAWSAGSPFHSAFAADITGTIFGSLGNVDLTGLSSGVYQVHLVAYDKAGNSSEATPVLFTLDNNAPVIKIAGDEIITITVGDTYIDDGATAVDNIDNVITNMIIANNNVDSTKVGEYTVTYNVSDSAGNAADQASRLVKVVAKEIPATNTPSVLGATVTVPTVGRAPSGEVLGATTTEAVDDASEAKDISTSKSKNEGEVKGTSDSKNEDKPWYEASIIGLAWYWWVLIVAVVVGLLSWLILSRRRNII